MSKYHVNQETDRAGVCRATKQGCPLGSDTPHFESKAEAEKFIETSEATKNSTFNNVSKKSTTVGKNYGEDFKNIKIEHKSSYLGKESVMRGNTFGEVIKNIEKDYEHYKNSPRMDVNDFAAKIEADAATEIEVEEIDYGYNPITYSKNFKYDVLVNKNDRIITLTTEDTDGEEPEESPFRSTDRELISSEKVDKDDKYNGGYYMDDYNDDDYPDEYSYTYKLTDEEYERLDNEDKFKELSKLKQKLDNPNFPDWTVFTPHGGGNMEIHKAEYNVSIGDYTLQEFDRKIKLKEEALAKVQKNSAHALSKSKEIESLNDAREELKEIISKTDNETVKKALNSELRNFDMCEENLLKAKENYSKKASSAFVNKNLKALGELTKEKDSFEKTLDASKKIAFENFIASRYPDANGNTRKAAAREWMRNNPDAYKSINREIILNG